jgi:predicted  nucleic acid-binding Zn-ribbon protein
MDTNTQTQIINILGNFITIVLPSLGVLYKLGKGLYTIYHDKAKEYMDTKINSIKNEDLRKAVKSAEDTLDKLITKEITNADVVLKPEILSAISKGTMTTDDINNLKNIVRDNVLKQIPNDCQEVIPSLTNDLNMYLNSAVETILGELKLDPNSPVTKTVIPEVSQEVIDNASLRNQLAQSQSQLQQVQLDKDNLSQQLLQVQEAKRVSEQSWQDLANQVSSLSTENQNLKAKLDSITQVVQPIVTQPVADNSNVTVDTTV